LIDIDVGYTGEGEAVEPVDCTPSNSFGHAITITDHPIGAYNKKYCRMEDWNNEWHFESGDGYHFYRIDLFDEYGVYCYNFDDRDQDGTNDYTHGGYTCLYEDLTYEDLAS